MAFRRPPIDTDTSAWVWKEWFQELYREIVALIAGTISDGDKGDITVSGGGVTWNVDSDAITNAKLANVATQTFKGRTTAGTGDPEDLTVAQAKTLLNLSGTNSGDQTITLTGDVTGSGTGSFAATIANDAVTNGKLANMANSTLKGRYSAGTGDPEDVTASQAWAIIFGTSATDYGDITINGSSQNMTVENDAISNAKLANMSSQTIKGRTTAGSGDPEDLTAAQAQAVITAAGPKFFAYRSAVQAIGTGAWTKMQFNTELYDTNSNFDNATNYRFTPTVAGYYQLSTHVRLDYTTTGTFTHGLRITKNGTESLRVIHYPVNGYKDGTMVVTGILYFNGSSDYCEVEIFQNSGANQNTSANTAEEYFCGSFVGA